MKEGPKDLDDLPSDYVPAWLNKYIEYKFDLYDRACKYI